MHTQHVRAFFCHAGVNICVRIVCVCTCVHVCASMHTPHALAPAHTRAQASYPVHRGLCACVVPRRPMELVRAGVRREQAAPFHLPFSVSPAYSSEPSEAGGEGFVLHGDTATSPPHRRCACCPCGVLKKVEFPR